MTIDKSEVSIYTDGGCEPNPGVGGWAAILVHDRREKELSGGAQETTNNRMEMTAAIQALSSLKHPCVIHIYTDSQYLKNGITQWMKNWKRNNWKTGSGPVKNKDLWLELDDLVQHHDVHWEWVKGHAGHHYNERCDELASEAIAEQKELHGIA